MHPASSSSSATVPVVAVGASSGGIKALEAFLRKMPAHCGLAFVVAMHLSREHESQLASILQGFTAMPVTRVDSSVAVLPNHVFVIAPGKYLALESGRLMAPSRSPQPGVIDHLFQSLATDRQEQAVGIVLSGSGADGTLGMLAIHERGGFLLAQDPEEAEYPDMPNSIIDTGVVDVVLPAADMPARLMAMQKEARRPRIASKQFDKDEAILVDILDTLRTQTGYDFNHYKRSTLLRQIQRRMIVVDADDMPAYVRLLDRKQEAEALLRNLLISVTRFFRDPNAYQMLEGEVIPELFQYAGLPRSDDAGGLRVWVPACATGEEVYSLAMLLVEQQEKTGGRQTSIQILATDIDDTALSAARHKQYTGAVTDGVSKERLARFFNRKGEAYEVNDALRALVVFSRHDLTCDPPFTRMDLVSCRNLLMYFNAGMQQRILKCFAYSLRAGGCLFLGAAEGIDHASRYFEPVSKQLGLYRRTQVKSPAPPLEVFPLARRGLPELVPGTGAANEVAGQGALSVEGSQESISRQSLSQQELVLANQEMQSLNEELRSMMEELEVAKEELQSLNEELITVNQELQNKIEEHRRVNNDLHVLIESTHMATLFLDRKLNIMLFTPECTKIYNLLPVDIGRPLDHISHRHTYAGILSDARRVLERGVEVNHEVQMQDGSWYAMRAMPYQSAEGPARGPAAGVVLTFADITPQKKMEQVSDDRFSLAFHAGPMAASIVSRERGEFLAVNNIFEKITGFSRKDVTGRSAASFGLHFGDHVPLMPDAANGSDLAENTTDDDAPNTIVTRIRTHKGAERDVVVSTTDIDFDGSACYLNLFHDITERKRLEREILLVSDREQRRIGADLHDGLGAHLSGVSMMVRGVTRRLRGGHAADPGDMEDIAKLLGEGIEQARSLAQGLSPFLINVGGLTVALAKLASRTEEITGITCTFEGTGNEPALSTEQSMHLYRIAQEAVTNAARHGEADHIRVVLSETGRDLCLDIHDDGIGFQPGGAASVKPAGMGLSIMRYRADTIGARLDVTGSPDHGTTVTCTFTAANTP